jgi:hypothetical protein
MANLAHRRCSPTSTLHASRRDALDQLTLEDDEANDQRQASGRATGCGNGALPSTPIVTCAKVVASLLRTCPTLAKASGDSRRAGST